MNRRFVYDDEDNVPMNDDAFDRIDQNGHNPTVYTSYAEMKAEEALPFTDVPDCEHCVHHNGQECTTWDCDFEPKNGCWDCRNYDPAKGACTIRWNNMDESYYNPDLDDVEYDGFCDEWVEDEQADWSDFC